VDTREILGNQACVHIFDGILRPLTSLRAIISENKNKYGADKTFEEYNTLIV